MDMRMPGKGKPALPAIGVWFASNAALFVPGTRRWRRVQVTYAANVAESDLAHSGAGNEHVAALRGKAAEEGCGVIIVSAQVRNRMELILDGCL